DTRAWAHQLGRSYCTVSTVPGGIDVTVETVAEHLARRLGTTTPRTDDELRGGRDRVFDAMKREITARTANGACSSIAGEFALVSREQARGVSATLHFECPSGAVTLHNAWRLETDPTSEVVCAIDGRAWAFRKGLE